MTEQPQTFMDELRFAAIRIMILTGFLERPRSFPLSGERTGTTTTPSSGLPGS